jgi:DNA-binding NarL/FixJ family response regulator
MNHAGQAKVQAKVIVATDRKELRAAVHAMLASEFDVVSVVYDADALLSEALRLEPDLVVVEASLSLRDEFRATREIMRRLPRTLIIHQASAGTAADAATTEALARAVRLAVVESPAQATGMPSKAVSVAPVLAPAQAPSLVPAQHHPELTTREREVLELLASGVAMKVIAHRLGITYRTVAFHKYKMMQRLGIRTNAGLTTYALRIGALGTAYAPSSGPLRPVPMRQDNRHSAVAA